MEESNIIFVLFLGLCFGLSILFVCSPGFAARAASVCRPKDQESDKSQRGQERLKVLLLCSAFMVTGPALMVLNKIIMQGLKFNYPFSLSGLGILFSSVFSRCMVAAGWATVQPKSREIATGWGFVRNMLPIGALKALTLASGNAAYLFLGLGFIQMLKAITPAIVLGVMWVFGMPSPNLTSIWCCMIIVFGTLLEVKGELNPSMIGLALMLLSEFTEAANLLLSQKLMQNQKFTVMEGIYFISPASVLCLFLMAAAWEWPRMVRSGDWAIIFQHLPYFLAAGFIGIAVNFLGLAVVQATSTLTQKILNQIRCIGLIFYGIIFFGEECTLFELFGYVVALGGFAGYNRAQMDPEWAERFQADMKRRFCFASEEKLRVDTV